MTNGEKIIGMFPNAEINYGLRGIVAVTFIHKTIFDLDWWNDEYKELTNKIDCDNTDCNNCVNHKYCDYESNKLGNSTSSDDCISRANALRVAKNEYLRGWHNALCKALSEKYSIHCEEGDFSVIQEETITGLGLSMNCAVGKDVESYMSSIPSVTPIRPKGHWKLVQRGKCIDVCCSNCEATRIKEWAYNYTIDQLDKEDVKGCLESDDMRYCPYCGSDNREVEE